MAMDPTFAKLVAIGLVGGVAKALLGQPKPTVIHNHIETPQPETPKEN